MIGERSPTDTHDVEHEDSGSGLIEAIVAITLLGVVMIGVVDASWTNTRVAAETRRRSDTIESLLDIQRVLRLADFSPCPHIDQSYVEAIQQSARLTSGSLVIIDRYEYWDPSSSTWVEFGALTSAQCAELDQLTDEFAVQRLRVSLSNAHGSSLAETFVKSREPSA